MRFGVSCVCVLVVLGQVRSQNNAPDLARGGSSSGPPAVHIGAPRHRFINGPTGFSVEGEHHRAIGVRDFVNGPTATSVDALDDRPQSTFMSGPTGISLFTEERRAEEKEQSLNVPIENSNDDQEHGAAGAIAVADGPIMTSVEEERPGLQVGQEEDGGRSSNRGIINTNPQEGSEVKQTLPPGFHIDTADGWDSDDWMYTGGEWSRINLPDTSHPDIPAPTIPGPALVVVTKDYLKKVTVTREFVGLTNVTLHYRFFLSIGVGLHGVPELKVYLVMGGTSIPLATEKSRGDWSDRTLEVPISHDSESFKIVFEARLMKEGNEISLDDITISCIRGNQFGGQDNSSVNSTLLPDDAMVPVPVTDTQPKDAANNTLLSEDDNLTDNKTSISLDEIKGKDTTQDEESTVSEIVTPPTNTETVEVEVLEKTEITQGNINTEIPVVADNTSVVDNVMNLETDNTSSVEWEEETVQPKLEGELNGKKKMEKLEIQTNAGNSKGKQEILKSTTETETLNDESIGNYNGKLDDGENETLAFPSPTDSNTTAEESMTSAETNLTDENTQTQDNLEATSATSNTNEPINDNVISSHMPSQPSTLYNMTQSVNLTDTPDVENGTFIPSQPQQTSKEASLAPSTSLNNTTTINNSGGPGSSSVTSTSDHISLINNSMSPSGAVILTATTNTTGTDSPVVMPDESATTSWRVFQVFLVLCFLGLLGLGFLYWKKKRKQEDEIPVFTRPTHTDYHNPTFNMDDDASFVSRGGRHNYKSFE